MDNKELIRDLDGKKCEKCVSFIPGDHEAVFNKILYARCRANISEQGQALQLVTDSEIPESELYDFCQTVRKAGDCSNFALKPYSDEAIDEQHRFDDEKEPQPEPPKQDLERNV